MGRARDAGPAPHPRALRARPPARRPPHRRVPARHDRDRQPHADPQGRWRRGRARRLQPAVDKDDVAAALVAEYGIATSRAAWRGPGHVLRASRSGRRDPSPVTMDDGCDLVSLLHSERPDQVGESSPARRRRRPASSGSRRWPPTAPSASRSWPSTRPRPSTCSTTATGPGRAPSTGSCGRPTSSSPGARSSSPATAGSARGSRRGWPATAPTSRSSRSTRSARSRR